MLLVKTRIGVSNTHGIGLFADQLIVKGTTTWHYHPKFDLDYTEEEIASLPEIIQKTLLHFSYFDETLQKLVLPGDNLRFINHTKDKTKINIASTPQKDVAARDIKHGEELLCDYDMFDNTYFERIGITKEDLI